MSAWCDVCNEERPPFGECNEIPTHKHCGNVGERAMSDRPESLMAYAERRARELREEVAQMAVEGFPEFPRSRRIAVAKLWEEIVLCLRRGDSPRAPMTLDQWGAVMAGEEGSTGNVPTGASSDPCPRCGGAKGWSLTQGVVACYYCHGTGKHPRSAHKPRDGDLQAEAGEESASAKEALRRLRALYIRLDALEARCERLERLCEREGGR